MRQQDYNHRLVINGKETNIVLKNPEYSTTKLRKLFPAIKKTDSVWYKHVEPSTTRQHGHRETTQAEISVQRALKAAGATIVRMN